MPYEPSQEDRFTVGLWCTQYAGREVFGREVRPPLDPIHNIRQLAKLGAWGFNFHDDDLVPFGSSAADTERILREAKQVMDGEGIVNSMVTCNMFEQPVFKDGALTSNDPRVRAHARQKGMRAIDMGAELGATVYVMWGGREGLEVEASKNPVDAMVCTLNCTVATEWLREFFGLDHAGVEAVLAASASWAQLCADAFQLPIVRPPKIEAAAVGVARQVRWAVDDVPVDAAASIGRRFDPTPSGALQAGLERASHLRDVVVRNNL